MAIFDEIQYAFSSSESSLLGVNLAKFTVS